MVNLFPVTPSRPAIGGPVVQTLTGWLTALALILTCWLGLAAPVTALPLSSQPVVGAIFSFSGTRPLNLGVHDGSLAACPATPNCVSSQSPDADHTIAPITYASAPEAAFARLKAVVEAQPRVKLMEAREGYLYAEFSSAWMGFVDDVEFYLDESAGVIQVRSASRLGESDLGVNRQRVEAIRQLMETTPSA